MNSRSEQAAIELRVDREHGAVRHGNRKYFRKHNFCAIFCLVHVNLQIVLQVVDTGRQGEMIVDDIPAAGFGVLVS